MATRQAVTGLLRPRTQAAEDSKTAREPEGVASYYCYGSLMDRPCGAARRDQPGEKAPATAGLHRIVGYHVMLWGPYPALTLTDEATRTVARAMAYETKGSKKKDSLPAPGQPTAETTGVASARRTSLGLLSSGQETTHS